MKNRTIIVHTTKGVFLGAASEYAMFSKDDLVGTPDACGFENITEAMEFAMNSMPNILSDLYFFNVPVPDRDGYHVSCVNIIKQGLVEYTHNMMTYLPMLSQSIH